MLWPVAALAVLLLGFVIVYGSVLETRVRANYGSNDDPSVDTDVA